MLACAAPVSVPAGRASEAPAPVVLQAAERTMVPPDSTESALARMTVPIRSATADYTLPVSAVHPSLVPAPILHAAQAVLL